MLLSYWWSHIWMELNRRRFWGGVDASPLGFMDPVEEPR